jgi:hypothetical protein
VTAEREARRAAHGHGGRRAAPAGQLISISIYLSIYTHTYIYIMCSSRGARRRPDLSCDRQAAGPASPQEGNFVKEYIYIYERHHVAAGGELRQGSIRRAARPEPGFLPHPPHPNPSHRQPPAPACDGVDKGHGPPIIYIYIYIYSCIILSYDHGQGTR